MLTKLVLRTTLAASLMCLPAFAAPTTTPTATTATTATETARVMLVGMFHFANPGQDMVKSRVIDVMAAPNQAYLDDLAARMATFRPTDVLAECSPADQAKVDAKFRDYVAGDFALPTNEIYQIGFRVARRAGLSTVTCFDEDDIGWEAQPMFDYMGKHAPQAKLELEAIFKSLSKTMEQEQASLSLAQLLLLANDPARDGINKALYLRTNDIGAGDGFAGADAAASWWHRNFRMYANIQKSAAPGRRVIALAGQGHTAIFKDLLAMDHQRKADDVRPYFDGDSAAR